jgi:hypothetical protein
MTTAGSASKDGRLEECVDDLNDFIASLQRYPHTVLALAMRTHLAALLQALLEQGECTRPEVAALLAELEQEVLRPEES